VLTIGGSAAPYATDYELDIKRTGTAIHTLQNSQNPYAVFVGSVTVTGKLTFVMQDETQFLHYLSNDKPSLDVVWSQGVAATTESVQFHCTKAAYTTGAIVAGKDYFEVQVDVTATANTTDVGASGGFSPVKVTMMNAKAAGTFA
jgi:hypothetical protein